MNHPPPEKSDAPLLVWTALFTLAVLAAPVVLVLGGTAAYHRLQHLPEPAPAVQPQPASDKPDRPALPAL
jgi:hypothetical protein